MLHKMCFQYNSEKYLDNGDSGNGSKSDVMDNGLKKKQPQLLKDELPEATE